MARTTREDRETLYRCTNAFTVWREGRPVTYGNDQEVYASDPILKSHRGFFEPSADRLARRVGVEQATAAPGELRALVTVPTPTRAEEVPSDEQEV